MVLLIDNYDSFAHNLARYLRRLDVEVLVLRNDAKELFEVASQSSAIVISPGPCGPDQSGQCIRLVQRFSGQIPILGVCLGHQIICQAFGGRVVRASRPIHGRAMPIRVLDSPLFQGLSSTVRFARYHSLIADWASLPDCLRVIASSLPDVEECDQFDELASWSVDDRPEMVPVEFTPEIMAVEHVEHPTFGVQFHPESILSEDGYRLLSNFLVLCGTPRPGKLPESDLQPLTPAK